MSAILTLVRKDVASFLRNRAAVVLTFLVPIALIYIFGWVFGLNQKESGPTGIRLAVVNASSLPAAGKLLDALKAEKAFRVVTTLDPAVRDSRPLEEADLRPLIRDGRFRYAVVIPADVVRSESIGLHLKIFSDPRNDIEAQTVNGLLLKTLFSNVPELMGESLRAQGRRFIGEARYDEFNRRMADLVSGSFGGDAKEILRRMESLDFGLGRLNSPAKEKTPAGPGETAAAATAAPASSKSATPEDYFSRLVKIDKEQVVGKDVKSPAATRLVGGWAIMFLLFAVSGSSAAFFDEENAGLFQRLLSAPVTRAQLLWSRFLFSVLLGLVQLTALFGAGRILYGIDVFGHFGNLVLICTFAAAACASIGMVIAALAPNAQAANGLATFIVMVMSATGGAWFPMSLMPEFMQKIGQCTIVYWSMEGFVRVLWAGHSFVQLLPVVGILGAITAGIMAVAIWRLNKKKIFA